MSNKILVTGATGNIGSALVHELKAAGADFAVMTSKPGATITGVDTRHGDFADVQSLTAAFTGIDTLFLLFPLVENKVQLAHNAVAAAKAAGVKHIVRSGGAGADAASSFALPKLQGEIDDVVRASGIAFTLVQPSTFMQNYVNYQSDAIKAGTIYAADNGQATSFIDTRDIAAVAARVLTAPTAHAGKSYLITGGQSLTGVQVANVISQALGRPVTHMSIATETAVATMQQWGMPPFIVNVMDSLNKVVSTGYTSGVTDDVEKVLSRKPRTFAAFAADSVAAWK
jgi:uncharacterized protein YbjT (DUF2867 family)